VALVNFICLLLMSLAASAAGAQWRAVLVGVSDYPTLPAGVERTVGARNDVLRLREVLRHRGFKPEHIRVLADGVTDALLPTRANILRALDDLAETSGPGDVVFVHFSGHGSLEPGTNPNDGPAPTFLPLDVGRWNGQAGFVENAIRQSDMRARVDRIANRGAFVWGVFDACHAAALVRRPGSIEAPRRFVEPAVLGVPLGAVERSQAAAERSGDGPRVLRGLSLGRPPTNREGGGTVFFYAAQAGESAVELKLPMGAAASKQHGLFSYLVAQTLQDARPMSYRQLGQAVLSTYAGIPAAYSTPVFTGNALDHLVLGQGSVPVRQWPLLVGSELSVDAGALSGLVPGAVLAVLPGPTASDADLVGHVRVVSAELGRATLAPVEHGTRPAPPRSVLAAGQYLRLVHSPPRYTLRVASVLEGCAGDCPAAATMRRLRSNGVGGADLQWVDAAESPDVLIRHRAGRIELVAATGTVVVAIGSPDSAGSPAGGGQVAEALTTRLAQSLHALARTRNLLALAARHLTESPSAGLAASLRRVDRVRMADEIFTPEKALRVAPGDTVSLSIENRGLVALDVTALYFDAALGITVLFPKENGESNRLAPGTTRRIDDLAIKVPPSGLERMLVIGRQATPGAERSDYSFLQQSSLTAQARLPPDEFDAFADAAFAEYRRRGAAHPAPPRGAIALQLFTLDVRATRAGPSPTKPQGPR
jgi:Caspase domain